MLSHTRMGVPYEYTHMGRPIRVWDNIRIWGRTVSIAQRCARKRCAGASGCSPQAMSWNWCGMSGRGGCELEATRSRSNFSTAGRSRVTTIRASPSFASIIAS